MGRIGFPELLVILLIVLLIFGAGKIPEIFKSMGQGIKEFKKGMNSKDEEEEKKENKG
jgi:sec-independent protein translocase protein TatA